MADPFEEGLKDLVSEQFKDNEPLALRDEKTGKFVNEGDDGGDEDEEADKGRRESEDDDDDDDEADEGGDEDGDEDEGADEDGDEDEEADEDDKAKAKDKAKGKGRFQKRVDALTASVRRLERELRAERDAKAAAAALPKKADGTDYSSGVEYARDQMARDEKAPKRPDPAAKGADGSPLYKLGEFDDKYAEDRDDYLEARRRYLDAKEKEYYNRSSVGNAAAAAGQQEFQARINEHIEAGKKAYKDFDEKVVKGVEKDLWPLSETGAHFLADSDVGADLAYYLATHVNEAKEIAALKPLAQAKRLTKLEDKIIADKAERAKRKNRGSSAPEPIRDKVRGGGRVETNRFASENFDDVEKYWNQANSSRK